MGKSEFRMFIKFSFAEKYITENRDKYDEYYATSIVMVEMWITEFPFGRTDMSDAERSGRPIEVGITETIDKI